MQEHVEQSFCTGSVMQEEVPGLIISRQILCVKMLMNWARWQHIEMPLFNSCCTALVACLLCQMITVLILVVFCELCD